MVKRSHCVSFVEYKTFVVVYRTSVQRDFFSVSEQISGVIRFVWNLVFERVNLFVEAAVKTSQAVVENFHAVVVVVVGGGGGNLRYIVRNYPQVVGSYGGVADYWLLLTCDSWYWIFSWIF